MTIDELRDEMQAEFRTVAMEFRTVETEFRKVYVEFGNVQSEFRNVYAEFVNVQSEFRKVYVEFGNVQSEFRNVYAELATVRAEIKAEGETTRRHMDMLVEQMRDVVKIVAEGTAANSVRLDDHDTRITWLEKRPPPQ